MLKTVGGTLAGIFQHLASLAQEEFERHAVSPMHLSDLYARLTTGVEELVRLSTEEQARLRAPNAASAPILDTAYTSLRAVMVELKDMLRAYYDMLERANREMRGVVATAAATTGLPELPRRQLHATRLSRKLRGEILKQMRAAFDDILDTSSQLQSSLQGVAPSDPLKSAEVVALLRSLVERSRDHLGHTLAMADKPDPELAGGLLALLPPLFGGALVAAGFFLPWLHHRPAGGNSATVSPFDLLRTGSFIGSERGTTTLLFVFGLGGLLPLLVGIAGLAAVGGFPKRVGVPQVFEFHPREKARFLVRAAKTFQLVTVFTGLLTLIALTAQSLLGIAPPFPLTSSAAEPISGYIALILVGYATCLWSSRFLRLKPKAKEHAKRMAEQAQGAASAAVVAAQATADAAKEAASQAVLAGDARISAESEELVASAARTSMNAQARRKAAEAAAEQAQQARRAADQAAQARERAANEATQAAERAEEAQHAAHDAKHARLAAEKTEPAGAVKEAAKRAADAAIADTAAATAARAARDAAAQAVADMETASRSAALAEEAATGATK